MLWSLGKLQHALEGPLIAKVRARLLENRASRLRQLAAPDLARAAHGVSLLHAADCEFMAAVEVRDVF